MYVERHCLKPDACDGFPVVVITSFLADAGGPVAPGLRGLPPPRDSRRGDGQAIDRWLQTAKGECGRATGGPPSRRRDLPGRDPIRVERKSRALASSDAPGVPGPVRMPTPHCVRDVLPPMGDINTRDHHCPFSRDSEPADLRPNVSIFYSICQALSTRSRELLQSRGGSIPRCDRSSHVGVLAPPFDQTLSRQETMQQP
jgi:hypothetical protein